MSAFAVNNKSPIKTVTRGETQSHLASHGMSFLKKDDLWAYLATGAVVLAISGYLAFRNQGTTFYSGLTFTGIAWAQGKGGKVAMFIALAIVLALLAWATAHFVSHCKRVGDDSKANLGMLLFAAFCAITALGAFAFYKSQNIRVAVYLNLVALILSGVITYTFYNVHPLCGYAAMPAIASSVVSAYVLWQLKINNPVV